MKGKEARKEAHSFFSWLFKREKYERSFYHHITLIADRSVYP